MSGTIKTYIGIMMLLISVVFTVPFSWLHQCEYTHAHAVVNETSESETGVFSQEKNRCPLCELEFPLYLAPDFFSTDSVILSFPVFVAKFPQTVSSPSFFYFTRRGPPIG